MITEQENTKNLPERIPLKQVVYGELETLKRDLQSGDADRLFSRISSEESGLTKTLRDCGIDLFTHPSVNPIYTHENAYKYRFGKAPQLAVFRSLVDGSGATPLLALNHLLFFYFPSEETQRELKSNFSSEFISEVEKSLNLVFAEELVHILQTDNRTEDKYFLSEVMKNKTAPPPGRARKSLVELDATLAMLELGFGPQIENTIWLAIHEDEYGETVKVAEWAKVSVNENLSKFLTIKSLPELVVNVS